MRQAGVGHVVFSSLEDPRQHVPKGALPELASEPGRLVSHFETKAETEVRWQRPVAASDYCGRTMSSTFSTRVFWGMPHAP